MSRLRILSLTLLLVVLAVPAVAQDPDIQKLIADAPGAADYPTADVITLYAHVDVSVDADGRCTSRVHEVRRILTNWAMRRVTDPRVGWDSSRQTLEVVTCRTYQEGGAVVDSPANALNEVTPDAVGRCAGFLDLREMVISHVGLEPGCVTELEYVVRDLEPGPAPASGQIFLQDRWPVLEGVVTLRGPGLEWEVVGGEAAVHPITNETDGVSITVRDVPGLPDEGNGAHRGDSAPSVVYAYGSIAGAAGTMAGAAMTAGDPRLADWLDPQDESDLTQVDALQRIAELVGRNTRSVHLPGGLLSRAPRPAPEVYDAGCASRWEKTLLAATLLRDLGLEPTVVLVSQWQTVPANSPGLGPWNDALVVTRIDGQEWWLSPQKDKAWQGRDEVAGHTLLVVTGPDAGLTETIVPADSHSTLAVDIRRDDDIYVASIDWKAEGALRGHEMDVDALAEAVARAVVPGCDVTESSLLEMDGQRAHLRVEIQFDELGENLDDVLLFPVPSAPVAVLDELPSTCRLQEPVRHTPLFLPGNRVEEITLELRLPEGLHVDSLPPARSIQAGGAQLHRSVAEAQGVIRYHRLLKLPGGRIAPEQWPALRGLLTAAAAPGEGHIVLTR